MEEADVPDGTRTSPPVDREGPEDGVIAGQPTTIQSNMTKAGHRPNRKKFIFKCSIITESLSIIVHETI